MPAITSGGGGLALASQAGGNAEAGQPHAAAYRVHQNVGRFDVLVDQPVCVHLGDGVCKRDGDAQEWRDVQWPAEQTVKGLAAGVLEHQPDLVIVAGQCEWARCPGSVEIGFERIFVVEPLE